MTKKHISSFAILLSLLAIVLTGCKNDPVEPEIPSLAFATQAQAFQASQNLSNFTGDPNAAITYSYVTSLQGLFSAYSSFLFVPQTATASGNNTWTWSDGAGTSVTYNWSESNGNNCVTISLNGPTVADGVYYEFCEKKDGTGGWMKVYDPENNNMLINEAIWTINGEESGTLEFIDHEFNDRQVVTWNADGSGSLKTYENTILTYESAWNADGTGSYKEYDSQGGLIDSGTWG